MTDDRALRLIVERLPSTESGEGRAFVDPDLLERAHIAEGSVVELRTHRGRHARLARPPTGPELAHTTQSRFFSPSGEG